MADKTASIQTKYGELTFLASDTIYTDHMARGQFWDGDLLDKNLQPFVKSARVILDIGGHVGIHANVYGRMNPDAQIYTFEPQPSLFALNQKNNEWNPRCFPMNVCVGQRNQEVTLLDHSIDGAAAYEKLDPTKEGRQNFGGRSLGTGSLKAKMITIDSLNLSMCDFIKMDIEGAESLALLGAQETIRKFKPVIFFESNHKTINQDILKAAHAEGMRVPAPMEILHRLGYRIFHGIRDFWCQNYLTAQVPYPVLEKKPPSISMLMKLEMKANNESDMLILSHLENFLRHFSQTRFSFYGSGTPISVTQWLASHNSGYSETLEKASQYINQWKSEYVLRACEEDINFHFLIPGLLHTVSHNDWDCHIPNYRGILFEEDGKEYIVPPTNQPKEWTRDLPETCLIKWSSWNSSLEAKPEKTYLDPSFIVGFRPVCSGRELVYF